MKPQKQLILHRPAEGLWGDCHRTAIAVILDMDAADVPHFMDERAHNGGGSEAHARAEDWLNERGISCIHVLFAGEMKLEQVLNTVMWCSPLSRPIFILGGTSKNGSNHSVVCCDGKIVCDPAIDESGIVGPCDDGFYWVTFFGAVQASNRGAPVA